jgi:hypothetical protein
MLKQLKNYLLQSFKIKPKNFTLSFKLKNDAEVWSNVGVLQCNDEQLDIYVVVKNESGSTITVDDKTEREIGRFFYRNRKLN